jgi:predicted N-acetyltransferase YhbS
VALEFISDLSGLKPEDMDGFFEGWPVPPSSERRLAALKGSDVCILAVDGGRVVGFATALVDGALMAYLPLLEVLPEWHGRGIGSELVRRVLAALEGTYSVALCCDEELAGFYARLGFASVEGLVRIDRSPLP